MAVLLHPIVNFDQLTIEKAYPILCDEILPICKENRIKLTICYSKEFLRLVKKYKKEDNLCSVEKVQKLFGFLDQAITDYVKQSIGLYSLKRIIKERKGENVTNAECIAAMLLKGYIADFSVDRGKLKMNCEFYKKLNKQ